ELGDWIGAAIDDADGAADRRGILLVVVDAQDAADGCHEVERAHGTFDHGRGLRFGTADDLPTAETSAEHDERPGTRIGIAPRLGAALVDPRRAAEFAHPDN